MFVDKLMAENFHQKDIYLVPALIGKPGHKGGNFKFARLLADVRARLLGDATAFCTTFFDFYGLPEDFPGKAAAKRKCGIIEKASCLEETIVENLRFELGDEPLRRFIPYVQMYEFEGLLFSNPSKLAEGINKLELENLFQKIRDDFSSPEEINNSPYTAPSKRIESIFSGYEKPLHGSLAALEIGLETICLECHRFGNWVKRLEALNSEGGA
jgi:hypothetical protein